MTINNGLAHFEGVYSAARMVKDAVAGEERAEWTELRK
jgi:hypothetical protein